ncbi:MAG TPA: hypothetical protein VNX01_13310 [Bacteroidia bacterium]|jgi:hypothetical protein|nr:hypothetical protein [Bacteroidia bacterium]
MTGLKIIQNLIKILIEDLKESIKIHKISAFLSLFLGVSIAAFIFWKYDIYKDTILKELVGISGAFIGTIFIFQITEFIKDRRKVKIYKYLDKFSEEIIASSDQSAATGFTDVFTNVFKETIK